MAERRRSMLRTLLLFVLTLLEWTAHGREIVILFHWLVSGSLALWHHVQAWNRSCRLFRLRVGAFASQDPQSSNQLVGISNPRDWLRAARAPL